MLQNISQPSPLLISIRNRLGLLKWIIPTGLVLLVVVYEVGPARLLYIDLGFDYHILADILIFGTVGPFLTFVLMHFVGRWLEERETSDLQAQILVEARREAKNSRQLNDHTLQILFATGTLISTLKSVNANVPSEVDTQLSKIEQELDGAIRQLRSHLQD